MINIYLKMGIGKKKGKKKRRKRKKLKKFVSIIELLYDVTDPVTDPNLNRQSKTKTNECKYVTCPFAILSHSDPKNIKLHRCVNYVAKNITLHTTREGFSFLFFMLCLMSFQKAKTIL